MDRGGPSDRGGTRGDACGLGEGKPVYGPPPVLRRRPRGDALRRARCAAHGGGQPPARGAGRGYGCSGCSQAGRQDLHHERAEHRDGRRPRLAGGRRARAPRHPRRPVEGRAGDREASLAADRIDWPSRVFPVVMRKVSFAVILGVGIALTLAPAALASTVTVTGGNTVRVLESGSEVNRVTVSYDAGMDLYDVVDSAANL